MKWNIYAIRKFSHLTETLGRSNSLIMYQPLGVLLSLIPSQLIRLYLCYWQIVSSKQCFSLLQFELTLTPLQIYPTWIVLFFVYTQLNKVNRCLARYSPRTTTTNRPTNRAPKKPAWPGPYQPKMPSLGQILSFWGKKSFFLLEES